jgi:hypothetical protein
MLARLLQKHYRDSLQEALSALYPHHAWQLWRFSKVPSNYWKTIAARNETQTLRDFLDYIGEKLQLKSTLDWQRISIAQIRQLGGSDAVTAFGGFKPVRSSSRASELGDF